MKGKEEKDAFSGFDEYSREWRIPVGYFYKNIITKEAISRVETRFCIHRFSTQQKPSHFSTHSYISVILITTTIIMMPTTCLNIK